MATIRGGEALQARLRELSRKVSEKGTLRAGFLEGATYPDGTPVAMVAAIQDYGAPAVNIPPRPFFRNVIAEGERTWGDNVASVLVAADYDVKLTLGRMGEFIKGQIQNSIVNGSYVPLRPATVRRKGGVDKPLIDTGHMLNSINYEVV